MISDFPVATGQGPGAAYWRKLAEGEVRGVVRPLDGQIRELRLKGLSLGAIGKALSVRRGYVQARLLRIAARE